MPMAAARILFLHDGLGRGRMGGDAVQSVIDRARLHGPTLTEARAIARLRVEHKRAGDRDLPTNLMKYPVH